MQTVSENQTQTVSQEALILQFVSEVKAQVDFSELKTATLEMYEAAQSNDIFNITGAQRSVNFQNFKLMYNLFLKLDMLYNPDINGVNTL